MEIAASLPDAPHWPQVGLSDALDPASTPRRIALVAVGPQNQKIAGLCSWPVFCRRRPNWKRLPWLRDQRRGLGRRLFDALVTESALRAASKVVLEVRASNHVALGFYRSLGLAKQAFGRAYYTDPVEDAVLMSSASAGRSACRHGTARCGHTTGAVTCQALIFTGSDHFRRFSGLPIALHGRYM